MSTIQLQALCKNFGPVQTLRDINLHISDGEFVCFVGPSGCGKSTLLRLIAGLEAVSSGHIHFDGQDLTHAAAKTRRVAMVFQSYALYPHMNVQDNLSFGMRMRGVPAAQVQAKLKRAVDMLQLAPYLQRKPGELSGGQCQRVAIGRAIVQEPGAFLFDEPLSNLDAELRLRMRLEIAALHRELGSTMVYVTHDQVEAMTLAQRIVVLRDGAIEQVGTPMQLYHQPANRFVAGFIGSPAMNFLPHPAGGHVGIRPEHLTPLLPNDNAADADAAANANADAWRLRVNFVERLGASSYIHGTVNEAPVVAESRLPVDVQHGDSVRVRPTPGCLHVFDANGRRVDSSTAVFSPIHA
jgi:lactose/L-arabinose transport system ATP-binding protein